MNQKRKMRYTSEKGITLLALVITIIVLLILAGVTISMVLGDDGIILQAQGSAEKHKEAEKEEQEKLLVTEEKTDLYTDGKMIKEVQIGDYVEYKYINNVVKVTSEENGVGVEEFDSSLAVDGENGTRAAQITRWRVLSKKDGVIKLISDKAVSSLSLGGAKGALNAESILNRVCGTLYSSYIGTAESIDIKDINDITKYDGTKFYYNAENNKVAIPGNEVVTIGDLENDKILGLEKFTERKTLDAQKELSEYEVNYCEYNAINDSYVNKWITKNHIEFEILFGGTKGVNYWLASSFALPRFQDGYVDFGIHGVDRRGGIVGKVVYGSDDYVESNYPIMAIRPVITLKKGLEVDGKNDKGEWIIKE